MLARAGNTNLYIIDLINFKLIEKIEGFWLHEGKPTNPIAAVSNLEAEAILGVSLVEGGTYLMHYFRCGPGLVEETKVFNISNLLPNCKMPSCSDLCQQCRSG